MNRNQILAIISTNLVPSELVHCITNLLQIQAGWEIITNFMLFATNVILGASHFNPNLHQPSCIGFNPESDRPLQGQIDHKTISSQHQKLNWLKPKWWIFTALRFLSSTVILSFSLYIWLAFYSWLQSGRLTCKHFSYNLLFLSLFQTIICLLPCIVLMAMMLYEL